MYKDYPSSHRYVSDKLIIGQVLNDSYLTLQLHFYEFTGKQAILMSPLVLRQYGSWSYIIYVKLDEKSNN